jgi:hypothetical protein
MKKIPQNFGVFCPKKKKKPKKYQQKNKGYKPHGCKLLPSTVKPKSAIFGKRNFFSTHKKLFPLWFPVPK